MPNPLKNNWWIILLLAGGIALFAVSLRPGQTQGPAVPAVPAGVQAKTDPVPPMAIVTSPVNGHEADYMIQVYSFQDKNRAATALQTLKNSGYHAEMMMSDLGEKGTWYRVRVIGIPDEPTARRMLDEIRKNYNSGFIVKPQA